MSPRQIAEKPVPAWLHIATMAVTIGLYAFDKFSHNDHSQDLQLQNLRMQNAEIHQQVGFIAQKLGIALPPSENKLWEDR